MSWLLVAFIPAFLMLATFGLSRLEESLVADAASPADVAVALEQAKAACALPPVPRIQRIDEFDDDSAFDPYVDRGDLVFTEPSPRSPARIYVHHRTNPEFRPTRQPDRV